MMVFPKESISWNMSAENDAEEITYHILLSPYIMSPFVNPPAVSLNSGARGILNPSIDAPDTTQATVSVRFLADPRP
jgi:hypothetical protein